MVAAIIDQLRQLHADLRFQYERDSEQELDATILPLIDSIVAEARGLLPEGSTVGEQMQDFVTVAAVENAEPVRVAAVMVVVGQLLAVFEGAERRKPNARVKSVARERLDAPRVQRRRP